VLSQRCEAHKVQLMMEHEEGLFGLAGRRLLVVEDNPACADAMREWLEICGASVTTVATVVAALERARARRPDLIVVDVNLPDGTGWDLLDQFRDSVPDGRAVPVVAITGAPSPSVASSAEARGVRHVIGKPIAPLALAEALSDCLAAA
jgi:CheY-like chemotaxis protein